MRCAGGRNGGAQHPCLVERDDKHIDKLVVAIIFALPLGAITMTLPHVALAQSGDRGAADIAPALNLEEIATPPGLPTLTVTNALGAVAHLFPTTHGAGLRSQAVQAPPLLYHRGGSIMLAGHNVSGRVRRDVVRYHRRGGSSLDSG